MKAHKHAELIKGWADGAVIEFRDERTDSWRPCPAPSWYATDQYRIKPERVYPMTQMTSEEFQKLLVQNRGFCESTTMARIVADASLKHACDSGQVVPREEFDRAVSCRKARDMAVAKEVVKSLCWVFGSNIDERFDEAYLLPVIARAKA
jgi:hypothetical protein